MSKEPFPLSHAHSTIAIVGVGLIGGSIAAALKKRRFAGRIIGVERNAARLEAARASGLIDTGATSPAEAATESNLLVFCTPVDHIVEGVRTAAPHCRPGTLLTDAGSVKRNICRALSGRLPEGVIFIGSHPVAGSEKQGFEYADADLFEDRICVVTPDAATPSDQLARLIAFWRSLGSQVKAMSAGEHDCVLAQTSHVPHVVAAALASTLTDPNRPLTAGGFRDTTRIAAGDPDLWAAILLDNADEVAQSLDGYTRKLAEFRDAIENQDAPALRNLLQTAKRNREALETP